MTFFFHKNFKKKTQKSVLFKFKIDFSGNNDFYDIKIVKYTKIYKKLKKLRF